jgi:glycosyltransferase involved in cell wall biosynthesis
MSWGLPCLASVTTGFPDIDRVVHRFKDAKGLSQLLGNLMRSPGTLVEMGKESRKAASAYSWSRVSEQYQHLINDQAN